MPLIRTTTVFAAVMAFGCAEAQAVTLSFPGAATQTSARSEALASYRLPVGPWTEAAFPTQLIEGALEQTAWRINVPGISTLALMQPLRAQIAQDGWSPLFECETEACGGFDFRYGTEVLPEPDMHIDLGDFRYLAARKDTAAGPEYLSLLVSRSVASGFVQLTRIGAAQPDATELTPAPVTDPATDDPVAVLTDPTPDVAPGPISASVISDIGKRLETGGSMALDDLVFSTGSGSLQDADYPSLAALAAYLKANPTRSIALVGHSDASGGLDGNIALSRKRAASVRQRLIDKYGVAAAQMTADGVGYLSPRDSNLTDAGRNRNRRVEVMLNATE